MKRRRFLQKTLTVSLTLPIGFQSCSQQKESFHIQSFGIQLWTVRNDMAQDPKGTLRRLSEFGYSQIESFGDGPPENMFWGMTPGVFKKYLDSIDLVIISAHCDSDYTFNKSRRSEFEKLAGDAAAINMKYLINPYMIQLKTIDDFKRAADAFNIQGEICKRSGLRFAYHNHNYSFREVDRVVPQSILLENTDPDIVDFEMDIYWAVDAGHDPIMWFNKYPNRFRLCHIKDHYPDPIADALRKRKLQKNLSLV